MNVPDRINTDNIKIAQKSKNSLITKADEYFQKKVPLVDVMNSIKELKDMTPLMNKLELKIAIQEDKITDLMVLLNERQFQNVDVESKLKVFQEDNEKRLREIIKHQEERIKDFINKKADIQDLQDLLSTKASKVDYGELYKKYSQIYIGLEPLIVNQDILRNLVKKIQDSDSTPDVQQQISDLYRNFSRLEATIDNRDKLNQEFKAIKKEFKILSKQVQMLYEEHIYSVDGDDSEQEIEKKKRKTEKIQQLKQLALNAGNKDQDGEDDDSDMSDRSNSNDSTKGPQAKPPSEQQILQNRAQYMNLYGFSKQFLDQQKVLQEYTADKVFRYHQLQINEVCDYIKKEVEKLKSNEKLMNFVNQFKSEFMSNKDQISSKIKHIEDSNNYLNGQVSQINNTIKNELLDQKKIHMRFKDFNIRLDNILTIFDENNDKSSKTHEDRLKRIVNLEADVHQLKSITNFLRSQKRELDMMIKNQVNPIKQAKYLYEESRNKLSSDISRLEQKLQSNTTFIANELENIKDPIQNQINDIKQEKNVIIRELKKVYRDNRDLEFENRFLKEAESQIVQSQSKIINLLNMTVQSQNSLSRERVQSRKSESRQRLNQNQTSTTLEGAVNQQSFDVGTKSHERSQLSVSPMTAGTFQAIGINIENMRDKLIRPSTSVGKQGQRTKFRNQRRNLTKNQDYHKSQMKLNQNSIHKSDRNNLNFSNLSKGVNTQKNEVTYSSIDYHLALHQNRLVFHLRQQKSREQYKRRQLIFQLCEYRLRFQCYWLITIAGYKYEKNEQNSSKLFGEQQCSFKFGTTKRITRQIQSTQ
ncbi:UNKNOWN [Stylonychia lemnae]|uniref:Uncharacterized protein n=1 Tax=Stylonychia lemnae TaxID=5949 RepID=A0A078APS8_STYLE|nr:UNKNOWN [Stylonychia lemnae]|eukprot:CDW83971.1 UNKNOWN [Stylonychia lemnae]